MKLFWSSFFVGACNGLLLWTREADARDLERRRGR